MKLSEIITAVILGCCLLLVVSCVQSNVNTQSSGVGQISPVNLRCEYLVDPLGIDVDKPRFSWNLESSQRGQKQAAYHVLVAGSLEKLNSNIGDVWNSGKVESAQSLNVVYGGRSLQSRQSYFWKVMVWGSDGQKSGWSKAASFGMGIAGQGQWQGKWIESDLSLYDYQVELKKIPDHNMETEKAIWVQAQKVRKMTAEITEAPAVWMRKEFKSEGKKLRRATLFISGLGLYEVYVNGQKINDHHLNVSPHDFGKTVPYHIHDVTARIEEGDNALGIILGNGYFNPVIPSGLREYAFDFIDTPRLKCQLQLEYENGSTQLVVSDRDWKFTTDGPIRFNSIRSGETYDGRKELGDWSSVGFDDKGWKAARIAKGPKGRLVSRKLPPVRKLKTIPAASMKKASDGDGYQFDFGVESTGWIRIKLRGKEGQKIVIKCLGAPSHTLGRYQTCEYICKGDGEEVYEPRFAFNGFKLVNVSGLDYEPELTDVVGCKVVSDLQTVGTFSCSDERINYLQDVNLRTIQNYNVAMPMDPVREKVCWTQDVQTNFETSAYNFDLYKIYSKWQDDYIDGILDNGFVPTVVPSCFDGPTINGPWWGGMIIFNPWQLYNFYGDREILSKSYDAMKRYLAYLDSIAKNGVIEWGLGDWMDIASGGRGRPKGTTVAYTSTCAYMMYADILRQTAEILGKKDDADYFANHREKIRKVINDKFYKDENASYDKGSQTSYLLALQLNIPSESNRARVVDSFKKQIAADNDHLSTGFVGTPFLLNLLVEEGLGDLAWKIATQDTYPSWYDMIFNKNNSVFKENWQGGAVQMPSLAAPIGAWFYRSLGGIRADGPGFKSFIVAPYTKTLEWVKCNYHSPYGQIVSDWSKAGGVLTMNVTVPVNTTATVYVDGEQVTESGKPADQAEGVTFLRMKNNKAVFKVQSGKYEFKSSVK